MRHVVKDARFGFYMVYNDVLEEYGAKVGPLGIAVYNALCYFASRNGTSFPSLQTIADLVGMSRPSVVKYLKVLKDCGLIEIEARTTEAGDSDSNVYTIVNYVRQGVVNDVNHLVNDVAYRGKADLLGVVNDVNSNNTHKNNTQLPTPPQADDGSSEEVPVVKKLGAVHKCWQQNMPGTLTPIIVGQINDLIDEYGPDSMLRAIEVAVNANVRTMRYIKGVLSKDGANVQANGNGKQVSVKRVEGEEW